MGDNDETFVKITNQDIYDEILEVKKQVTKTNGSVAFNRKWLGLLSTLVGIAILFFGNALVKLI